MTFIELKNLSYTYPIERENFVKALDNINLSIAEGEFVAVLGANSSGKSTLAKHLNALLLPTAGHCYIDGRDTLTEKELWRVRKQVGMVFQNPDNQLIASEVEDDVAFGAENLGLPREEILMRVDEALRLVEMQSFRKSEPHLLSGGQKQRVAIAGALAMATKCIVLDEPTSLLDPAGRAEVWRAVEKLHKEHHLTIVWITHFMEEAVRAKRIVVMSEGKIVLDGTPHQVFARSEQLKKLGIGVPLAEEFAMKLKKIGLLTKKSDGVLTADELVECLRQEAK